MWRFEGRSHIKYNRKVYFRGALVEVVYRIRSNVALPLMKSTQRIRGQELLNLAFLRMAIY